MEVVNQHYSVALNLCCHHPIPAFALWPNEILFVTINAHFAFSSCLTLTLIHPMEVLVPAVQYGYALVWLHPFVSTQRSMDISLFDGTILCKYRHYGYLWHTFVLMRALWNVAWWRKFVPAQTLSGSGLVAHYCINAGVIAKRFSFTYGTLDHTVLVQHMKPFAYGVTQLFCINKVVVAICVDSTLNLFASIQAHFIVHAPNCFV